MTMAQYLSGIVGLDTEFNIDRTKQVLAEIFNIPQAVLNTPDEKKEVNDAKVQAQQLAMLAENAGGIGSGIKDLAEIGGGQQ
jgi:hypothetical protein